MKTSWVFLKVQMLSFLLIPAKIVLTLHNLSQLPKIHLIVAWGEVSINSYYGSRGQASSVKWAAKEKHCARKCCTREKTSTEVCFIINLNRFYVQTWLCCDADRLVSDVLEKEREIWGVEEVGIYIHLSDCRSILIILTMLSFHYVSQPDWLTLQVGGLKWKKLWL